MNKILLGLTLAAASVAPALAGTTTIEFKRDTGEVAVVTLDDEAGTATMGDQSAPYTFDAETITLCMKTADGDNCVVFDSYDPESAVGDSVGYTAADGAKGTATITAKS